MSIAMSLNEQLAVLEKRGIPRHRAMLALGIPAASAQFVSDRTASEAVTLPFRLTLPWSALVSDNKHKRATTIRLASGEVVARLADDSRYKQAKDKTREIACRAAGSSLPVSEPLSLVARVFVPDGRTHDVCNFAKCCLDALTGVVYSDDRWVYRVTWERAGTDVDAPRAELTLEPYR